MTDIVERVGGPHEWGYRDVTDGTFIPDNAPFEAAAEIERLTAALQNIIAGNGGECGCAETARRALEQKP